MNNPVVVGTRVYSNLYNRGYGTVFAIHGNQKPENIVRIGNVVATGGNARFDVVFDCGLLSEDLPECILHGKQWRILDEVKTQDFIAAALASSALKKAQVTSAEQEMKNAFQQEIEALKTNPDFKHLKQGEDSTSGKLAASNIRIELKRAFPGVTFSVRKTDYGSVRIEWTNGPTKDQVETLARKYKAGSFDSMEDMYCFDQNAWAEVFGGFKFISTCRHADLVLIQRAIDEVFSESPEDLASIQKPTAEEYKAGLPFIQVPWSHHALATIINIKAQSLEG